MVPLYAIQRAPAGYPSAMLYLASRSPRRTELLSRLDRPFRALDLDVPERRAPGESALDYVQRVAADKARAGLVRVANDPEAVVLGSDTEVILDGEVFGKPADAADAAAMLRRLSGRTHQVATAVAVVFSVALCEGTANDWLPILLGETLGASGSFSDRKSVV